MTIRECPSAEFLHRARPWLEEREVEHNLILGIAQSLAVVAPPRPAGAPPAAGEPFLAVVEDDAGEVVAAAARTPPHPLVVTRAAPEALRALAEFLIARGTALSGVNGPAPAADAFAVIWASRTGAGLKPRMRSRIYETGRAVQPAGVGGRLRLAGEGDVPLVALWWKGFSADALEGTTDEAALDGAVRAVAAGRMFLWHDGAGPRSMAAWSRPSRHGICLSAVYTPPEFRRKGYASACVAALSQCLLDQGRRFVCLFADQANPTSNGIYQRIGFTPVCDFANTEFLPPPAR